MISGLLLCQHTTSPGQWIGVALISGIFIAPGTYWMLRADRLAERSRARGYMTRGRLFGPLRGETPAVYFISGLVSVAAGVAALVISLAQRNPYC